MTIHSRIGAPPRGGPSRGARELLAISLASALAMSWQARGAVTLEQAGHLPSPRYSTALSVQGGLAYGIGKLAEQGQSPSVLRVFDLSDPAAPVVLGSIDVGDAEYALLAGGDHVYYARARSLRVVNVSDPANPYQVASLPTPSGSPFQMCAGTAGLFWTHQGRGVMSADISDPIAPFARPTIDPGGLTSGVAVNGEYLYVSMLLGGLYVFDVSGAGAPIQLGYLPLDGYSNRVAVGGGYAYVAGDSSGLQIIDVSDPTEPLLVAGCTYPEAAAVDVKLVGRYALLGLDTGGVAIVDVADPTNPVCNPPQPVPGLGWVVDVSEDYLVVGTFFQGLAIYRIRGAVGACCAGGDCWETVEEGCDSPLRGDGPPCDLAELMASSYTGCFGDLDGTGHVSPSDRGFVAANFGTRDADALCMYDLDGNGVVNAEDRLTISRNVGQCLPLPDYQDGSGMNQGAADLRFRSEQQYMGFATTCSEVDCSPE